MKNFILTILLVGLSVFFVYTVGGEDLMVQILGKNEVKTKVITEPVFKGKSVFANLVIMNDNEYAISNPTISCDILNMSGKNIKTAVKVVEDFEVDANAQKKIDNYSVATVDDVPSKMECRVAKFQK